MFRRKYIKVRFYSKKCMKLIVFPIRVRKSEKCRRIVMDKIQTTGKKLKLKLNEIRSKYPIDRRTMGSR